MTNFKSLIGGIALSMTIAGATLAAGVDVNASNTGLARQGYDPVAYFTDSAPTKGDYRITSQYNDATYWFSSEEHKATFEANPEAYAPAYGGFCAFGTAMGFKFDGDPNYWEIVDNKLYLNLSEQIQDRWQEDIPGFITSANSNWTDIEDKSPEELQAQ